jgi:hypothetical protein
MISVTFVKGGGTIKVYGVVIDVAPVTKKQDVKVRSHTKIVYGDVPDIEFI